MVRKRFIIWIALAFWSCSSSEEHDLLPAEIIPYFASEVPSPERNPLTEEGIALGRMLFYDPALSANGKISCASCHEQSRAFTDGRTLTKIGVSGKPLLRHAPSLVNLAWHENGLFWEGGANDLESLVFGPLTHPDEMAMDLTQLVKVLKMRYDYTKRFEKAFGIDTIHVAFVARALAQFQRTLVSENSHYDKFQRNEVAFSEQELNGMNVFEKNCATCHSGVYFTDHNFHNNGIDSTFKEGFEGTFQGRYRITLDSADMGKFKTPSLRNVMVTAPYMHDGRFATMQDVLKHYTEGIHFSSTLDTALQGSASHLGLTMSEQEQQDLITFLHTLTDSSFLQNPRFSIPF